MNFTTIKWLDNALSVLDQRALPTKETYLTLTTVDQVAKAIKNLTVRGAPLIGVTAAMGIALTTVTSKATTIEKLRNDIEHAAQILRATRPTAVNLAWGIKRMLEVFEHLHRGAVVTPDKLMGGKTPPLRKNDVMRNLIPAGTTIHSRQIFLNKRTTKCQNFPRYDRKKSTTFM